MAKVIATEKGYFAGVVRDIGEKFTVPDDIWNDKATRPSWVVMQPFNGKGDLDGDGKVGGSKPQAESKAVAVVVPEGWAKLPAEGRKALAKTIGGEDVANAKEADAIIAAYVASQVVEAEPFADAPEPQTMTEAQKASGEIEPDWVAPGGAKAVAD